MLETSGPGLSSPRAFLQVAGGTVARHQLALALALECGRILCHARELNAELVSLQHLAEAAGAQFHVVTAPRQLSGLVTASDELIVVTDGVLVAPQTVQPLLESGPVVLVQPEESGIPRGFERIDINHAAAGVMRLPGRLVEALTELPSDCDVASSLTRIALQSGVPQAMIPSAAREDFRWNLVRDEGDAHALESGWIDLTLRRDEAATPGAAVARLGVRLFGPPLLHGGSGGRVLAAGAGVTLFIALVAGWSGWAALALALTAVAWVVRHAAALVLRLEGARRSRVPRRTIFDLVVDLIIVLLPGWAATPKPAVPAIEALLVPLLFVCLLRILPHTFERRWTAWVEDRALICVLLAVPAAAGKLTEAVELGALFVGVAGALLAAVGARLTRT